MVTTPEQQAVQYQKNDGADDRGDEASRFTRSIPARGLADVVRQEGAGNTEQRGDDQTAWIATRHEELGNDANDETDEVCADDGHR